MHKYLVRYAFKHTDSTLRPVDQMWGYAVTTIETDKEPTTSEEFKEIAKQLFRTKEDCSELRIIDIADADTLPEGFENNMSMFLSGDGVG